MTNLNRYDLQWILRRCPTSVLAAMKALPNSLFLAGGFIRSVIAKEQVNDIDLFITSVDQAHPVALELSHNDPRKIHKTDNAFTIKEQLPIQIIFRWVFENPEKCMESFDFTISKSAVFWDGSEWQGICSDTFYEDLAAKRLIYTSPVRNEDAGGSMLRLLKFYQRGYCITLGSLGSLMARMLSGVKQVNFDKRAIIGTQEWEAQMGHVLTGLLREVDPAIDPKHVAHLSDLEDKPNKADGVLP